MTDRPRGAEFDLIERIRRRVPIGAGVVLGIGDDAAVVQVPPGQQLVIATDTLNAGVHFPVDTAPADIGWKALAVNLSDLAAMGARPAWCTLSLSLPDPGRDWVDGFLDGFLALATLHGVALVGGDTTRGPLSVCVTAHGLVSPARELRRDGARAYDDIWVSGTLGDAAGALALLSGAGREHSGSAEAAPPPPSDAHALLLQRLNRPTPRVACALALVGIAHSAIDVSDGLLADLGHICAASGVAAEVQLAALPVSAALGTLFDPASRVPLQATGGDDYELCFTAPGAARAQVEQAGRRAHTPLSRIGRIRTGEGVQALSADGGRWQPPRAGYVHFAG